MLLCFIWPCRLPHLPPQPASLSSLSCSVGWWRVDSRSARRSRSWTGDDRPLAARRRLLSFPLGPRRAASMEGLLCVPQCCLLRQPFLPHEVLWMPHADGCFLPHVPHGLPQRGVASCVPHSLPRTAATFHARWQARMKAHLCTAGVHWPLSW